VIITAVVPRPLSGWCQCQLRGPQTRRRQGKVSSSSEALTVELFTKTIDGVDQQIAYVEFEFTGTGDHTAIWTGAVARYTSQNGGWINGEITEWQDLRFASDYERYKAMTLPRKDISYPAVNSYIPIGNRVRIKPPWLPPIGANGLGWNERDEKSITITWRTRSRLCKFLLSLQTGNWQNPERSGFCFCSQWPKNWNLYEGYGYIW